MSFLEYRTLHTVEVGFLPIRHTHSEIYQTFSTTSRRLQTENAITMEDLHGVFGNC